MNPTKTNPVLASIIDNLKKIEIVYKSTETTFKGDKENTAASKEVTVREFVESYLDKAYSVGKGKIYSMYGETNNIDCVVLSPSHPQMITPQRKINIAEGVYCAIEVKPDIIREKELLRAFEQLKSVKNLQRDTEIFRPGSQLFSSDDERDFYYKIPAILFSSKSPKPEKIIRFFRDKINSGDFHKHALPDVIVTLDHGVYFYSPHIRKSIFAYILKDYYSTYPDSLILHLQSKREYALVWFLFLLLNFPPNNQILHRPILYKYLLEAGMEQSFTVYKINEDGAAAFCF